MPARKDMEGGKSESSSAYRRFGHRIGNVTEFNELWYAEVYLLSFHSLV